MAHRADEAVAWTGLKVGAWKQMVAKREVDALRRPLLRTDLSYDLNGSLVEYGRPGSMRLGVVELKPAGTIEAMYEFKFGAARLTAGRIRQTLRQLRQNVPVTAIKPA